MTTEDIIKIIRESSLYLKADLNEDQLQSVQFNQRSYELEDLPDQQETWQKQQGNASCLYLNNRSSTEIKSYVNESKDPIVIFATVEANLEAELLVRNGSAVRSLFSTRAVDVSRADDWLRNEIGEVVVLTVIPYKEIVGENEPLSLSPTQRLFKLFGTETKDIGYILIYALIIGLLSLVFPLVFRHCGVHSGGFSLVCYILIGACILGVLATGVLQIVSSVSLNNSSEECS